MRVQLVFCISMLMQLTGCAATYESACHELANNARSEIRARSKAVKKGTYERHFILLETGNEISSTCRSHFIDSKSYGDLPKSATDLCRAQSTSDDKYCTVYLLDGEVIKTRVY